MPEGHIASAATPRANPGPARCNLRAAVRVSRGMTDPSAPTVAERVRPTGHAAAEGFDDFVLARATQLVRLARGLLRDPRDAEDVVQDVLVRLHRHWRTVCTRDVPDAYVRRALVNACISLRRRGFRREVPMSLGPTSDHLMPARPDTAEHVADRDLVMALLRGLPTKQRTCLVLRHYEQLSDAEIAAVLGISVQTVRSNIHRANANLRRVLDTTSAGAPDLEGRG